MSNIKKLNNVSVEDSEALSQYNPDQVIKDVHSLPGHYLRTKESLTVVDNHFDMFSATYDGNNNPTEICYFAGVTPYISTIGFSADVSGSLDGTYFLISAGRSKKRYAIVYNVNSSGNVPSLVGIENVIVDIQTNDPAAIVAYATELAISNLNKIFSVKRRNAVLELTTIDIGETDDTIDVSTGFIFTNTLGTNELTDKVYLTYSGVNPIWQGQELKGYKYNIYTGRFETVEEVTVDLGPLISKDPVIYNVDMVVSGQEYSQVLPVDTKRFQIGIRDSLSKYTISYQSAGAVFTYERGVVYEENGLKLDSSTNTIYFKGFKDNLVMEIITWT